MSQTMFKNIPFSLGSLVGMIELGQIGLPDLQRPFVWPNKKVRDLIDSMYQGYPVGYLLLWETEASSASRSIGPDGKQMVPQYLLIDGQQRLTSLFAVLKGQPVLRESLKEELIEIAFSPIEEQFKVVDAATRRDPRWISNISIFWQPDRSLFELAREYIENLERDAEVSPELRRKIEKSMSRLAQLEAFPFTALSLAGRLNEEEVAEVFVRINSKGTPLNQADFILTLMSVYQDTQRKDLEEFCRRCRVPSKGEASPFNYFIEPHPEHLLRVAVGLGFRRARLKFVYSILRGKDLETGEISEERQKAQFAVLEEAQDLALNIEVWQGFIRCLLAAGFRGAKVVSSKNALLYCYVFYLIGRRDYKIQARTLRRAIARWFFFVALTGRYTDSPETKMEQDLADLREVHSAEQFLELLERNIQSTLTADYWNIVLPEQLATSSARSPGLFAYYAALVLLDAKVLFSSLKISELLDPAVRGVKSALERHHLFPKANLYRLGVQSYRETNQIANYALVEWPDNVAISDRAPSDYFPELMGGEPPSKEITFWHALPERWYEMSYSSFLGERRKLMAQVIRAGFERLSSLPVRGTERGASPSSVDTSVVAVLRHLSGDVKELFGDFLEEPLRSFEALEADVRAYLDSLKSLAVLESGVDFEVAEDVGKRCLRLLERFRGGSEVHRRLIQAATLYFILDDDAEPDLRSESGFEDDRLVVAVVERALGES